MTVSITFNVWKKRAYLPSITALRLPSMVLLKFRGGLGKGLDSLNLLVDRLRKKAIIASAIVTECAEISEHYFPQ